MSDLTLITSKAASAKVAVLLRAKKSPLSPGQLRCGRCGSQTYARVVNGAFRGKKGPTGGTIIYSCVCYDCLMGGVTVPMFWDVQSVPTASVLNPTPKGI